MALKAMSLVGLDVHARHTHATVLDRSSGELSACKLRGAPGDRVKTDRRDSLRPLRLLAAGELSFVFVPSVEDERFRDLGRALDDLRRDLMRARHRLSKFLLRTGER
jgi:transposase